MLYTLSIPDWNQSRRQSDIYLVSTERGLPSARQLTFTKDKKEARERTDVGSVACHPVHTVSPVAALLIHCDIVACIIAELDREQRCGTAPTVVSWKAPEYLVRQSPISAVPRGSMRRGACQQADPRQVRKRNRLAIGSLRSTPRPALPRAARRLRHLRLRPCPREPRERRR